MVHYTRVQGLTPYADEAEAVARAARDVGLRIGFAVAMRDRHGLAYADDEVVLQALRPSIREAVGQRLRTPARSPADWLALLDEVAVRLHEAGHDDHCNVQYGPAAVQWCSTPLLEAIARASADTGRRVHMHLLETAYQRAWADQHHPGGIVRFLDAIGLLSPRLTVAHCTHARPDELALLAERGVGIAVNTSSNLGLKSGIAPVAEMLRQGCRVGMGLDGMSLDEDDDALRELRLAWLLHRGRGFDVDMTAAQLWDFGAVHGRHTVMGPRDTIAGVPPGGHIAVGASADLMLLDWDGVDDEAVLPGLDPLDLLLAHASAAHITDVFIAGRQVVSAGQVTGVDEPALRGELLARLRSAVAARPEVDAWRRTLGELAEDLGPFYRQGRFLGCC
jgi:cytosine/adenosine deaminase-related metal-dependent hydrolase